MFSFEQISPSNEGKIETIPSVGVEPEAQSESSVSADVATNTKEEVQVTSLAVEEIKTEVNADKPAALEEGEKPQMEETAATNASASSADSVAKQDEPITKVEDVAAAAVPVDAPKTEQEPSTQTTVVSDETLPAVQDKTPVAESNDAESSRSAVLKSEKTVL